MSKEPLPITEVMWITPREYDFVPATQEDFPPFTFTTVGYLFKDTADYLVLVREYSETLNQWRGVVCIPKGTIIERRAVETRDAPQVELIDGEPSTHCPYCGIIGYGPALDTWFARHMDREHPDKVFRPPATNRAAKV